MANQNDNSRGDCSKVSVLSRRNLMCALGASALSVSPWGCAPVPLSSAGREGAFLQGALNQRLQRISGRVVIIPANSNGWRFQTDRRALPLAFADNNSVITLSAGLFNVCQTDGHVGAMMAHRVALFDAAEGSSNVATLAEHLGTPVSQASNVSLVLKADLAAIKALAQAGYDPRDAREVWQLVGVAPGVTDPGFLSLDQRLAAMATELRKLGYQV